MRVVKEDSGKHVFGKPKELAVCLGEDNPEG